MIANMRSSKNAKLSEIIILESKAFHSITVEGEKKLFYYSCLILNREMLLGNRKLQNSSNF